jgi:hypothetical protein
MQYFPDYGSGTIQGTLIIETANNRRQQIALGATPT